MLFAQMGNRVKPIQDAEAQKYLSLGYNIMNESNTLVYEAVPQDVMSLKSAFTRHTAQIAKLSTDLATALAKLDEALKLVDSLKIELDAAKDSPKDSVDTEVVEKPKRTRQKKSTT